MKQETIGWTLSVLAVLPLLLSGTIQLLRLPLVVKNLTAYGWNPKVLVPLGVAQYAMAALYLLPQTAPVGAILATGWMGGAIATHLRVGEKPLVQAVIPMLAWAGLALRDPAFLHLLIGR